MALPLKTGLLTQSVECLGEMRKTKKFSGNLPSLPGLVPPLSFRSFCSLSE